MKHLLRRHALWLGPAAMAALARPMGAKPAPQQEAPDTKLPNGKSQRDEILKLEHTENIRDAAQLLELAQDLKADIEKNDTFVLSMGTIKKTDDIEKLAKKIRSRLRH